ncbi:MAG: HU family DNA-binding protein [Bacteroidaceae bacterium]|nr:HU family DNA-binding protein [Bacteroidaceae bacterium]
MIMLIVRKAKKKIVRPEGMREAWVYQSPALPAVQFKDVVKECAESCGEHPSKTLGVVNALMDRIAHYLEIGRTVRIDGIGTLKPVINSASAPTAEELGEPTEAIKGVKVRFYPHGPLQEAIAENGFEYQSELDDE